MTYYSLSVDLLRVGGSPEVTVSWVTVSVLAVAGANFGCVLAECVACTIYVNGGLQGSSMAPLASVDGASVTTIEGLKSPDGSLHALQQAWIDQQVPQCGYCQSGQLMSAAALLAENPNPSDSDIDAAMKGTVCRCGMYGRIRSAIKQVAGV